MRNSHSWTYWQFTDSVSACVWRGSGCYLHWRIQGGQSGYARLPLHGFRGLADPPVVICCYDYWSTGAVDLLERRHGIVVSAVLFLKDIGSLASCCMPAVPVISYRWCLTLTQTSTSLDSVIALTFIPPEWQLDHWDTAVTFSADRTALLLGCWQLAPYCRLSVCLSVHGFPV